MTNKALDFIMITHANTTLRLECVPNLKLGSENTQETVESALNGTKRKNQLKSANKQIQDRVLQIPNAL